MSETSTPITQGEKIPLESQPTSSKVAFKKRSTRPKQSIKASFKNDESDESDDDSTVVRPSLTAAERHRKRLGQSAETPHVSSPQTGSTPRETQAKTSDYLNELKSISSGRQPSSTIELAPTIEPQTEPEPKGTAAAKGTIESDYIPLDPDEEPDDGMGPETPNVLDIDEGAGYEDDELPIGDRMTRLRLEQKRREMQQAIDEYSDDSQSDDEWERSRLHNARQTVPEALFHKKDDDELTEIPPVPRPEDIMGKVYRNLQSLKLQRQEMSERLLRLQNERELLGSRTSEIQIALDRTSQEFERISAEGGGSRESII